MARMNSWISCRERTKAACLGTKFDNAIAVMALPPKYHQQLRKHQHDPAPQRGDLPPQAGDPPHFPNDVSALRLIGTLPAEPNERWQGGRCLGIDAFAAWPIPPVLDDSPLLLQSPVENYRHGTNRRALTANFGLDFTLVKGCEEYC